MSRHVLLLFTVFCLLIASVPLSADNDKPSIAIMGYGWFPSFEVTEGAIFDML